MKTASLGRGRRFWLIVGALAVLTQFCTAWRVAEAQEAEPTYAVLIVGDEGDAEMLRREKVMISEMAKRIRQEANAERLPIFSYHFNKERERAYCENKLNVLGEDLLFVGIVTLDNKVPLKVVYRIDRIVNPSRAAKDVLQRAEELLAEGTDNTPSTSTIPVTPPNTPSTPTVPVTPPSNPATPTVPAPPANNPGATTEGFNVQLGSFSQLKYAEEQKVGAEKAGFEVRIVNSMGPDGTTIYKVLSLALKERTRADELLAKFKTAGFEQAFLTRVIKP